MEERLREKGYGRKVMGERLWEKSSQTKDIGYKIAVSYLSGI